MIKMVDKVHIVWYNISNICDEYVYCGCLTDQPPLLRKISDQEAIGMKKQFFAIISACMAGLLAAEGAQLPVYAADQPISAVMFENVCTSLTIGEAPDFTAYLTGDTLLHASILNEGWACTADSSVHASKSEGLPVPDEPTGVPYCYLIALKADPGWYFPDDVSVYYNGVPVSSDAYSGILTDESRILMLNCDFIPQVTPLAPDAQALSAAYIFDAVLDYCAGESPRFTARPADPSLFEIVYERWVDDRDPTRFVTSSEQFNAEMGLTDENRLTVFEAGGQYHYDICIAAKYGYIFSDDAGVYVNGMPCTVYGHPADIIPVNDVCVITVKEAQTTAKPVTTTAKPVTTTAKPVMTTAKPVMTTAKPVTTTTKPVVTTAKPDPDLLYGDVNQDGRVSVSDAVLLLRYITEDSSGSLTDAGMRAADMNLDGYLDLRDVTGLLRRFMAVAETQTEVPPQTDESDDSGTVLPDIGEISWIYQPEGSSSAFTANPAAGLTVSATENVLSYDGQLRFSEMTTEEMDYAESLIGEEGALLLDGWHIDAGLGADEHLPGYYACDYDLSNLNIPEDMYDRIRVMRIDDDGTASVYASERDGANLHWESDQNSLIVIVGVPVLGVLAAIYAYKLYSESDTVWKSDEPSDSLRWAETDHFYIQYADLFHSAADQAREKRMKAAVQKAEKAVYQKAVEETQNNWIAWAYDTPGFRKEVNRNVAKLSKEYLQSDADYQADLAVKNSAQADVILLGQIVEKAYWYLRNEENCPYLSEKPVIYFGSAVKGDGAASKTWRGKHYILLHRDTKNTEHVLPDTNWEDIYGKLVNQDIADRCLITMTHETYHIFQNTKLSTHSRSSLKFSEMSAVVIEHRAGKYFLKNHDITAYKETLSNKFETYGIPLEQHNWSESYLIPAGYTLGNFWEFVENRKTKSPMKGWDMVLAFQKYGSILNMMNNIYGFAVEKGENPNKILGVYWREFQKEVKKQVFDRAEDVDLRATEDDTELPFFPSLMNIVTLNEKKTQAYIKVKNKDFACTPNIIKSDSENWAVILERDKGFAELQPQHFFLYLDGADGKPIGKESRQGPVLIPGGKKLLYSEVQNCGNCGGTGYTVHFIPAPATPEVTIDEKAEIVTVKLKSKPSTEGTAGLTDRFLLVFNVNGKETYTQTIGYDKWQEELKIPLGSIKLSPNQKNAVKVTVCELIDAGLDRAGQQRGAVRTAACKPFEQTLGEAEFPVIDTDVKAQLSYGNISTSGVTSHFTLNQKGEFTWRINDHAWEAGTADPTNPFSMADGVTKGGSITGFTVKGKAQNSDDDGIDLTNWDGIITECSPAQFEGTSSYLSWDGQIYLDEELPDDFTRWEVMSQRSVSGGFSGKVIGTLHFKYSELLTKQYEITLVLSPALTCKEVNTLTKPGTYSPDIRIGSFEEKKTEDSVKITAKLNAQ